MLPYYLLVMAGVTYALRVIPLLLMRRPLRSRWINSFLFYVPWAVLTAMTIPAIFYATSHIFTACVGLIVGVLLALFNRSLATVALGAAVAVYLAEICLPYLF